MKVAIRLDPETVLDILVILQGTTDSMFEHICEFPEDYSHVAELTKAFEAAAVKSLPVEVLKKMEER